MRSRVLGHSTASVLLQGVRGTCYHGNSIPTLPTKLHVHVLEAELVLFTCTCTCTVCLLHSVPAVQGACCTGCLLYRVPAVQCACCTVCLLYSVPAVQCACWHHYLLASLQLQYMMKRLKNICLENCEKPAATRD